MTHWKLLLLLFCLGSLAVSQEGSQKPLFFVLVSDAEPVTNIRFNEILLLPRKKKTAGEIRPIESHVTLSLRGNYVNSKRTLYIAGNKINLQKDGGFNETISAEFENNQITIPIYVKGEKKAKDQEAVLRISLPPNIIMELDSDKPLAEDQFALSTLQPPSLPENEKVLEKVAPPPPPPPSLPENERVLEKVNPPPTTIERLPQEPVRILHTVIDKNASEERPDFLGRATLASPVDRFALVSLFGVSVLSPVTPKTWWEFRVSLGAGRVNNSETALVVEPGILFKVGLNQSFSVSAGSLYQYWLGSTTESIIVPTAEITFKMNQAILACRHLSLGYNYLLGKLTHSHQLRTSFLFEF